MTSRGVGIYKKALRLAEIKIDPIDEVQTPICPECKVWLTQKGKPDWLGNDRWGCLKCKRLFTYTDDFIFAVPLI